MSATAAAKSFFLPLALAAICLASCGGKAGPSGSVGSQSRTPQGSVPGQIPVPAGATTSQIDTCLAEARSDGPGTTVVFPAGKFAYSGTLVVPDYVNLSGQGIWDQGTTDGGGGTWLQCPIRWGSYSTIAKLLVGFNAAGKTCTFTPCAMGSSACGPYTQAHGSTGCTFSLVRFKGGSDTGAALLDTQNWGAGWSTATDPLKKHCLIDTTFSDCEFERPQASNSVGVTKVFKDGNPGSTLALWVDMRPGGAQVYGDSFIRCHFGVKNGYHSGIDGYGVGTTILCQPGPSTYATSNPADRGPNMAGGSNVTYQTPASYAANPINSGNTQWNPAFDWSQVDHQTHDITFRDCLFEYANWTPLDVCDIARAYSMWQGIKAWTAQGHSSADCLDGNAAAGYGNPPGAKWTTFPSGVFVENWDMTDCYMKGEIATWSDSPGQGEGEVTANCTISDCFNGTGSFLASNGVCGDTVTGTFSGGHPASPLFTVDWSGAGTDYTPSPYDP